MPDRLDSQTSPGITDHRPGISEHFRAFPNISGHFRTFPGIFGHERRVACGIACRRIASHRARRVRYRPSPDRVPSGASRAVSLVAGHGGEDGCRVRYGLSPDRVRYRPSFNHVSSCPGSPRRPHVSAMVTVGCAEGPSPSHAPAQQSPVADAANRCLRTYFRLYAVALHHCPSGGAAKADRWAARIP